VSRPSTPPADHVFRGGRVSTVDARRTRAEAVAITGGTLVYVGDDAGVRQFVGNGTRVIDLGGRMLLPGFFDSHVHLASGGLQELQCNLFGIKDRNEVLSALRQCVAAEGPGAAGWILGAGWDNGFIRDPDKLWLDEISPDRPMFLNCMDGHSAWINSAALRLAGITGATPDPPTGRIQRDPSSGEATGWLYDSAVQLVKDVMPEPTLTERIAGLQAGIQLAHRYGITSIIEPGIDDQMLSPYLALADRGDLPIRLRAARSPLNWQPGVLGDEIFEFVRRRHDDRRDRIDVDSVKVYIDGVIENGSAAVLEPYLLENLNERAEPFYSQAQLDRYVTWLDREGIQIHSHAIGDRAVRMALNAYQAARVANGPRDNRHHICHLQMIDPDDVGRFAALDVMATFQPFWAQEDFYKSFYRSALGEERVARTHFLLGSVHRAGGRIVGGSDWFVTSLNPLDAISVGIRRIDPALPDGAAVFGPAERVDLDTMLAAYTINGAYASHREESLGSIEVGKRADLIVLDRDLGGVPAADIAAAAVEMTMVDGEVVFDAAN